MKAGKCHEKLSGSAICWLTESFPCKHEVWKQAYISSSQAHHQLSVCAATSVTDSIWGKEPLLDLKSWRQEPRQLAAVSRTGARERESPGPRASWRKPEVEDEIGERGALNSIYFGTTNCCQEVSKGRCNLEQCWACLVLWQELVWSRTQEPAKVPLFGRLRLTPQEMCSTGCNEGIPHQNLNLPNVWFGISIGDTRLTKDFIWPRIFV